MHRSRFLLVSLASHAAPQALRRTEANIAHIFFAKEIWAVFYYFLGLKAFVCQRQIEMITC